MSENQKENESIITTSKKRPARNRKKRKTDKIFVNYGKNSESPKKYDKEKLENTLNLATNGLNYISETDSDILPFAGQKSTAVDGINLLKQIKKDFDTPFEIRDFDDFFQHITKVQDWFSEDRIKMAIKYQELKKLLEDNLTDLKVINIGRIELDVYVVGLDKESNLMGVKTKAVET